MPASEMAGSSVNDLDQVIVVEEMRAAPPRGVEMHCKLDDGGYVLVDRNGTASMQVMAMGAAARLAPHGEVKGPTQIISPEDQGRRVADFLFGMKNRSHFALPIAPVVAIDMVWSSPPLGAVGLSAEEARKAFKVEPRALVSQHIAPGGASLTILAICVGEDDSVVGLAALGSGVQTLMLGLAVMVHSGVKLAALEGVLSVFVPTPAVTEGDRMVSNGSPKDQTRSESMERDSKNKSEQVLGDVDQWALKVKKQLDRRQQGLMQGAWGNRLI